MLIVEVRQNAVDKLLFCYCWPRKTASTGSWWADSPSQPKTRFSGNISETKNAKITADPLGWSSLIEIIEKALALEILTSMMS